MDFGFGCASIKAARSASDTGVELPWYILGEFAMADEEEWGAKVLYLILPNLGPLRRAQQIH